MRGRLPKAYFSVLLSRRLQTKGARLTSDSAAHDFMATWAFHSLGRSMEGYLIKVLEQASPLSVTAVIVRLLAQRTGNPHSCDTVYSSSKEFV